MFNLFEQLKTTVKALKALIDYKFNILDARIFNILHDGVYEEITVASDTITWDGIITDDMTVIDGTGGNAVGMMYLVHVSDVTPSVDDLANGGSIGVIGINGEDVVTSDAFDSTMIAVSDDGLCITVAEFVLITKEDNVVFNNTTLPKKGIYFIWFAAGSINANNEAYISSLTINNYTGFTTTTVKEITPLKKIDKKYIPGGLADWNVNDSTASGYIENRPFHDALITTEKVSGNTITWDCNVDGLETDNDRRYCRVSSTVLPEYVFESDVTVSMDGYSETYSGYDKWGDIIFLFDGYVAVALKDNADDGDGFVLPKAGIYFPIFEGPSEIAITFSGYNGGFDVFKVVNPLKKIDKKFLPDNLGVGAQGTGNNAEIFNNYGNNSASGYYSHAEGDYTAANGDCAHAEGQSTSADAWASHAEGYNTYAGEGCAHAEGYCTEARGVNSHAEGFYTSANGSCQHVQGKYNKIDSSNTYAHIVGGGTGTSASQRKNIHTLDWNGNAEFAGDVKINACDGENPISLLELNATVDGISEVVESTINAPRDYMFLNDSVTSEQYVIQIREGELVSFLYNPLTAIEITELFKTEYIEGQSVNHDDMVVTATYADGTKQEISSFEITIDKTNKLVVVTYKELNITCATSRNITITPITDAISDFTYTKRSDGIYELTGWNGTLNGVTSTECIIPDSDLICV